jgi:hypothetical protein
MKALKAGTALATFLAVAAPAMAHGKGRPCSVKAIAGSWIFATGVGEFPAYGGNITAIGTMKIDRQGTLAGTFDFTVSTVVFQPDVSYTGTVTVEPDCTGTVTIETSAGTTRTDSIAVVGPNEFWGMSQDPANLWTYRARRISTR